MTQALDTIAPRLVGVPVIETERLILRAPGPEDFPAWEAQFADAEVMRHIGGAQPRLSAWRNLTSVIGAWSYNGFSMFSIIEKTSGAWIGRLGPWRPDPWPGNEIGWAFSRQAWGKGYATEAGLAAVDYAFETLGWTACVHSIDPLNAPSIAVAERLGSRFLRTETLPPPGTNLVSLYGQDRSDWLARRAARV